MGEHLTRTLTTSDWVKRSRSNEATNENVAFTSFMLPSSSSPPDFFLFKWKRLMFTPLALDHHHVKRIDRPFLGLNQLEKVGFDLYSHLRMALLSSLKVSMWTTASQRWEQGRQAAKVASRLMLIFPAGFLRSLQSINKEPSPNSKGGKHRESIMPKLKNLEMYLKQGGEGIEERKVVIHLRSQAVVDPGPLNHISSYFLTLTWILPGLTSSSCTDRLNPT